MNFDKLPDEIRTSPRCVVYRLEPVRAGRLDKVPYQIRKPWARASVAAPEHWASFAEALAVVAAGEADGPGLVLGDGLVGIDLDHVRDPQTGAITEPAARIIAAIDSYTELSPSRTGVHILARGGPLPPGPRRRGWFEIYDNRRFFTVTGAHLPGTPTVIRPRGVEVRELHARIFPPAPVSLRPQPSCMRSRSDDDVIGRAKAARNGAKFAALWAGDTSAYRSPSEADLALTNLLAFWTNGDPAQVDRLFRRSQLMRRKWDTGSPSYGARTIAVALDGYARQVAAAPVRRVAAGGAGAMR